MGMDNGEDEIQLSALAIQDKFDWSTLAIV